MGSHPRFRAVIYDHDGTLVDSLDIVVAATNAVLAAHGAPPRPRAEIIAGMVDPTGPRLGGLLEVGDPQRQAALAAAFYNAAHACDAHHARVYPGVAALVAQFTAMGVVQGVISNNQGTLVRRLLRAHALADYFAAMHGEEDMPAPKPDPRGLVAMVAQFGIESHEVIYVGDTVGDLHTAQAAGVPCVGVAWGITARSELERHDFLAVIDEPSALLAL